MKFLGYDEVKKIASFDEGDLNVLIALDIEADVEHKGFMAFIVPMENKCCFNLHIHEDGYAWAYLTYIMEPPNLASAHICQILGGCINVEGQDAPSRGDDWVFHDVKFEDIQPMLNQLSRLPVIHTSSA